MRRASLPLELHEVMASCSLHTRPHKRICLEDRPEPSQLCCHADEWMEQGEDEMNVEPSQSPFPGRRASSCADEEYQTYMRERLEQEYFETLQAGIDAQASSWAPALQTGKRRSISFEVPPSRAALEYARKCTPPAPFSFSPPLFASMSTTSPMHIIT